MTDRIERDARLLCEAWGVNPDDWMPEAGCPRWRFYADYAERLHAAGLTLARIEPDEATVLDAAKAIDPAAFEELAVDPAVIGAGIILEQQRKRRESAIELARAAYRAAVGEG